MGNLRPVARPGRAAPPRPPTKVMVVTFRSARIHCPPGTYVRSHEADVEWKRGPERGPRQGPERRRERGAAVARLRRPGSGRARRGMARARRMGHGRPGGGDGRRLGVPVPVGDRGGGGRSVVGGAAAGGGHRGHPGGARFAAGVGVVGRGAARGDPAVRRHGAHRRRHRTGLRGQRGREAGGGRGEALPGPARCGGGGRRVPASRRLVVPEQPRHARHRSRGRSGRPAAPPGGRRSATGRGRGTAAGHGGCALPARRAGRLAPRGRDGRGRAARVPAARSGGGVSARATVPEAGRARRFRPRGRRPPRRRGCPPPAGPGWSSHAP